jgi:HSP20 family protein
MLMRFDPFRELDRLTEQIFGTTARPPVIPMDAFRQGDRFVVNFDLPGVDPSSIDLTIERNVLTVSAERTWNVSDDQDVIVAERPHGRFSRQIFLGEELDAEHIEASYDHGVLTVTMPVHPDARPRHVAVTAGERAPAAIGAGATSA